MKTNETPLDRILHSVWQCDMLGMSHVTYCKILYNVTKILKPVNCEVPFLSVCTLSKVPVDMKNTQY